MHQQPTSSRAEWELCCGVGLCWVGLFSKHRLQLLGTAASSSCQCVSSVFVLGCAWFRMELHWEGRVGYWDVASGDGGAGVGLGTSGVFSGLSNSVVLWAVS